MVSVGKGPRAAAYLPSRDPRAARTHGAVRLDGEQSVCSSPDIECLAGYDVMHV